MNLNEPELLSPGSVQRKMVYHQQNSTKCGPRWKPSPLKKSSVSGKVTTSPPVIVCTEKLSASRWYGKTFNSVEDAKPLICRDEDGNLYSDVKSGNGEASLWNIEFRG